MLERIFPVRELMDEGALPLFLYGSMGRDTVCHATYDPHRVPLISDWVQLSGFVSCDAVFKYARTRASDGDPWLCMLEGDVLFASPKDLFTRSDEKGRKWASVNARVRNEAASICFKKTRSTKGYQCFLDQAKQSVRQTAPDLVGFTDELSHGSFSLEDDYFEAVLKRFPTREDMLGAWLGVDKGFASSALGNKQVWAEVIVANASVEVIDQVEREILPMYVEMHLNRAREEKIA